MKSTCFKWNSNFCGRFPYFHTLPVRRVDLPRYSPTGKVGTEGGASSVALLDAVEAWMELWWGHPSFRRWFSCDKPIDGMFFYCVYHIIWYYMLCMLGNVSCPPASNMAIENPKSRFACIIEAFPSHFCTWWFKLWLIYVVKVIWNLQVGMLYAVYVLGLPQYLPSGIPLASSVTSFLPSFQFNRWRACLLSSFCLLQWPC